jgi:hypothetical protein
MSTSEVEAGSGGAAAVGTSGSLAWAFEQFFTTATLTIASIDDTWEHALIEEDQASATRRFVRVKVSYTQL